LPLYQTSAQRIAQMQQDLPLQNFIQPYGQAQPLQPMTPTQTQGTVTIQQPVQNQFGIQPGQQVDGYTLGSDGIWYDRSGLGQGNNWQPPSIRSALGLSPVSNAPLTPTQTQGQSLFNTGTRSAAGGGSLFPSQQTQQPAQRQAYNLPAPYQTATRAPEYKGVQDLISRSTYQPYETGLALRSAQNMQGIAGQLPGSLSRLDTRPQGTMDALGQANQLYKLMGTLPAAANLFKNQTQGTTEALQEGLRTKQIASTLPQHLTQLGYQTQGTTNALQTAQALQDIARRQVTGAGLQQDPGYLAAIKAYESAILPQVQNQAALQGLGRTTGLGQATAAAQAQYLLPTVESALGREQAGIERQMAANQFLTGVQQGAGAEEYNRLLSRLGYEQQGIQNQLGASQFYAGLQQTAGQEQMARQAAQLSAQENVLGRQLQAGQFRAGLNMTAGDQDLNRLLQRLGYEQQGIQNQLGAQQYQAGLQQQIGAQNLQALQAAIPQQFALAQDQQNYLQSAYDRQTQDFLRQQALAEQALYQPFGMIAPTAIGQTATTQGKK